jgi:fructokinase
MPYAVVIGEALIDLISGECGGEAVYRPAVGGAPLNVAAGLRRLGAEVEFVGAVSTDTLGQRIWDLLTEVGVGTRASPRVDVPTTLAVTSLHDGVPEFTFYGDPPSFARLDPAALERRLVQEAAILYCGSIALMYEGARETAERAWSLSGPLKVLDPNVRPTLMRDRRALRATIEALARTADLVKLSAPDAEALFEMAPDAAMAHLREVGARAVVLTLGSAGAITSVDGTDRTLVIPAPAVEAVDTTGAGDACTAALMYGLLTHGAPSGEAWREVVEFAMTAASLACEVAGGATAMPPLKEITRRSGRRSARG